MKIVFVNPKFHPIVGGGETYLYDIALLLQEAGHEVTVLTAPDRSRNLKTYPFTVKQIIGLSDEQPEPNKAAPRLYQYLKRARPDVLHVHGYMSYWLLLPFIDAIPDATKVLSIHSTPKLTERIFGTFKDYEAESAFARYVLEHPSLSRVFVGSEYYASCLRQIAPKANLEVLPFFVRQEVFPFTKERSGHRILFPSRILERKGIYDAIKMLGLLPKSYTLIMPAFDRNLPDSTHERTWELIGELGLSDRVEIPDKPVRYGGMHPYYDQALVTVLPSHYEGFGIVLLESMSTGTPVVATDIPGINEVIRHAESGLLVLPNRPDMLAESVKLLSYGSIRQRIIQGASSRAGAVFDPTSHINKLLSVYKDEASNVRT